MSFTLVFNTHLVAHRQFLHLYRTVIDFFTSEMTYYVSSGM